MLNYDNIVSVNVSINRPAVSDDKFATGLIIGPTDIVPEGETMRVYDSVKQLIADGYTDQDPEYEAAALYFAQDPAPKRVYVASMREGDTAQDVFQACRQKASDFYGVYAINVADAQLAELASAMRAAGDCVLFYENGDEFTSAAPQTLAAMAEQPRAFGLWSMSDYAACAAMGLCMGYMARYQGSDFTVCFKPLQRVAPDNLSESRIGLLTDVNANVFVKRGKHLMLEKGTLGDGMRYNERMQLDSLAKELADACAALIVNSRKLPQTDKTTARFISTCAGVLNAYTARGVLADGVWRGDTFMTLQNGDEVPDGYLIMADDYAMQSDADRALKKAVPLYIALTLAGGVESILINLDVQL